uniref:Integrase core domain containing protein n=1 Tax=Solanum tuberosum TaxID=4113 RepID=M1DAB5_SOLTU
MCLQRSADPIDSLWVYPQTVNGVHGSQDIPVRPNTDPTPNMEEPNWWCVDGQWKIYRDTRMLNEKEKITQLITEECRALTGSLHTTYDIYAFFQRHRDSRVPISHYDKLIQATKTLVIGLIRDEANLVAPQREPQVEVILFGVDLVADVEQMQVVDPSLLSPTEDVPASHSPASS